MTIAQVGSGSVAIVPVFKGFRRIVTGEVEGATKAAGARATAGFRTAGSTAGKSFSQSFKSSTSGLTSNTLKQATADVAKASREVSAARLKEQDATGKVRVAQAELAAAQKKYASDSAQVIRAEERLASSQRGLDTVQDNVRQSTDRLAAAKRDLAQASDVATASNGGLRNGLRNLFSSSGGESARSFNTQFRSGVGAIFAGNFLADLAGGAVRQIGIGIQNGFRYGLKSIDFASDLNENLNATRVTFGDDIAKQLEVLGSTAPTRLALTRKAFAGLATQFSSFAKTIRRDDPAGFIDELTERGADFASVYNLEVADALELFQSGLAGETEPLRKYAIDLSAASVETFAYASGIGKVGRALTESEKIQARYGLLLKQTSAVQGDNANTANDLAGQQRRLNAQYEEAQTALGQYLIPAWTSAVRYANQNLIPALGGIIDKVGPKLSASLEKSGPKFDALMEKAAPLAEQFLTFASDEGIPGFISLMDDLVDAAPAWIETFGNIYDGLFAIGGFIGQGIEAQEEAAFNQYVKIGEKGKDGFASGLGSDPEAGKAALKEMILSGSSLAEAEAAGGVKAAGDRVAAQFAQGVSAGAGKVKTSATSVFSVVPRGVINDSLGRFRVSGENAGKGFAGGLTSPESLTAVRAASKAVADVASRALDVALEINSPSKRWRRKGVFSGQGYALGLSDSESGIAKAAARMVDIPAGSSVAPAVSLSAAGAAPGGAPAIYVQNPFTGEYLLAQVAVAADGRIAQYDSEQRNALRRGVR